MKKQIIRTVTGLLMLSFSAKALSFLTRILQARLLDERSMTLLSMILPTAMLLITLSQLGLSTALSKLIAETKQSGSTILTGLFFCLCHSLFLTVIFLCLIPVLGSVLQVPSFPLRILIPLIPLNCFNALVKGILTGRKQILVTARCQLIEEGVRMITVVVLLNLFPFSEPSQAVLFCFTSFIVSELVALVYSLLHLHPCVQTVSLSRTVLKELVTISLSLTAGRLSGSLTHFLEPLILSSIPDPELIQQCLSVYTQIHGYILPLITLPGFLSLTLGSALLPWFITHLSTQKKQACSLFLACSFFCLGFGVVYSIALYLTAPWVCSVLYHKTAMVPLLRFLCLPFMGYALQPCLASILIGCDQSIGSLQDTLAGCLVRLLCLIFLPSVCKARSISIALVSGMLLTTFLHLVRILVFFRDHMQSPILPQTQKNR